MSVGQADAPERLGPGTLGRWTRDDRSVTAHFGRSLVSLTALDPGLVHVRLGRDGAFAPRRSWALTTPSEAFPTADVDVIDEGHTVWLVTSELEVGVSDGGRVSIVDVSSGEPLLSDGAHGGPNWASGEDTTDWLKKMPDGERYYGFGERLGLLEKRGRRYTCWTTDEWRHQGPTTDELYVAIPFFMALGATGRAYGVLLDNTFRTSFDLTDLAGGTMRWRSYGGALDWYYFAGPEPARVLERLTDVVGRMPLPPRWALGYHQSRWGYESAAEIVAVARELRGRNIPADAMHLDIDHMDDCRTFTWDPHRFPDPSGLVRELAGLDFETVVIVSAGVKEQPEGGYGVYDEGRARDVFLRTGRGADAPELTAYVWPGRCVFPDHVRDDVRRWWGGLYRDHVELGIRGWINDMNEPAMHDLPIDDPCSRNIEPPLDVPHGPPSEQTTHAEVRNLYAYLECKGTYEALRRALPDERPFLLSRSGCAGIQRYAGTWTGDLSSLWEHLEASLPQIVGLGLSGQPFAGADIGGFFESCTPELLVRWTQLGTLMPFARNHSARGTAPQEPWIWGDEVEESCAQAIGLRYRLLPYLYTLFEEASRTGTPIVRPLFFHYSSDERTRDLSDQALLGRDLLLAPVVRPGVRSRAVYLPFGRWTDLRTEVRYEGQGWILVSAELDEQLPVFVRSGAIVPFGPPLQHTDERSLDPLELHVFPDDGRAEGVLYEDDGRSFEYERGSSCTTRFTLQDRVVSARRTGPYRPSSRAVRVVVEGHDGVHELRDDGDWEYPLP